MSALFIITTGLFYLHCLRMYHRDIKRLLLRLCKWLHEFV